MISRSTRLGRLALVSAFALAAAACAAASEEPAEDEVGEVEEPDTADEAKAPKVESNATTPQNRIGEKGSSCPIWQCGFNGLEPDALRLVPRLAVRPRGE